MEHHYDEEVLAEFLAEPNDAVSRDKHLASCDLCVRTLDSLRATAHVLREPAVWDRRPISTAPRPETLAFLRGVARTMADEDAMAALWIKELLAGPREGWAAKLEQHPEWRTGGMVRRLLKAGDRAIDTTPADATAFTGLAVEIADTLGSEKRHLQGLAHYDRAYALWYSGAIAESLEELDRADERLREVVSAEFDRGRVAIMRAFSYHVLERRDDVLSVAGAAAAVFRRYEDKDRFAAARSSSALTLQTAQRLREALAIHVEIAAEQGISDRFRIAAIHNMALCFRDLGEFAQATECLRQAISGYERLGMITFRSKSRWVLAQVLVRQQQYGKSLPIFRELRQEFEELGMSNDVAMISLDIAEALLAANQSAEISEACQAAMTYFASAGLTQTEPALRSLAYLKEAAASGKLTPEAIRSVRTYLLAPSHEPKPLFLETQQ